MKEGTISFFNSITEQFQTFFSSTYIIYSNNFIKDIKKFNEEMNSILFEIKDFLPGNINSFTDNSDIAIDFDIQDNDESIDNFHQNFNKQCDNFIYEEKQNNINNNIDIINCSV